MRKQWLGICIAAGLLAACSNDDGQQQTTVAPQPAVCNGPVVEISGAEPHYEAPVATANQDYERDGKRYKIVQNPANFSQAGLAAIYDAEPGSNLTASGEAFDPMQLTAAHPTLPIPSYARITNLANGRMIVVRINDRGPYGNDRVISLSRAAADRLNTSNNTKVRIDPIIVAQDGSLSGPGMACTKVAQQTYALPARPDLGDGPGSVSSAPQPVEPQGNVHAISNDTLKNDDTTAAPVRSGGFLGAPTPLASGVLEGSADTAAATAAQPATTSVTPTATPVTQTAPAAQTYTPTRTSPVTAPGSVQGNVHTAAPASGAAAASSSGYMVQVGAVSDQTRAQQYQQRLAQQFAVPGRVTQNGAVWRVQLGPFSNKADASALQQRLQNEAQLQSFVTNAQ
ncbi:endolytic peptidoglycan transglycosylase RlpA [Kosakonia quasisacchari]|uniref:Endolytic peptidoglycan transglycosylase RlpA n=1 Tax=Kosakonia quasisacchari TaxID=2529380 RepID=A0A4V2M181_9ENTR|nr:endolytic peptidoglycan transglycosylase RlpA [Kosakonia quasisacchari]TCC14916.1 endolytic peptidoglycan transglycosylase RlpA [Kosakonia quasisacchari]